MLMILLIIFTTLGLFKLMNTIKLKNWKIKYIDKVDSTMDEILKDKYKQYNNIFIFCGEQVKGRGRGKNQWVSQKGNLFASIKTRILLKDKHYLISYVVGIIIYDVIKKYLPKKENIIIKWPNDILVNKKKIAGILIEMSSIGKSIDEVIIGIGLNILKNPDIKGYNSICLLELTNIKSDINIIIKGILNYLERWKKYLNEDKSSIKYIINQWMKRSIEVGTVLEVKNQDKIFSGIYKGIGMDGEIKLLIGKKIKNFYNLQIISF